MIFCPIKEEILLLALISTHKVVSLIWGPHHGVQPVPNHCAPPLRGVGAAHLGWMGRSYIQPLLVGCDPRGLHLASWCWTGACPIHPGWVAVALGGSPSGWVCWGPVGPPDVALVRHDHMIIFDLCRKHPTTLSMGGGGYMLYRRGCSIPSVLMMV